ncbi:hypothetical protein BGX23_012700 [Mortierella sp. AD031]|nr:hypothetical protein BGX23_012700 [Mortierella sp. AD031]
MVLPIKKNGIFTKTFKIYFLCECDDHQGWHHRGNSQVHIANHAGYELERPTEFFRKHGNHVVRFMTFLKYTAAVAGVVVPVLSHTGVIQGLDDSQRLIRDLSEDVANKMDFAIKHLNSIGDNDVSTSSDRPHQDRPIGQDVLSAIQPLTGPELRQLQSFLRVKDGENVYANLHKTVTAQGHVRWVCEGHMRDAERPHSLAKLQEFLGVVDHFDSNTGVLGVFLTTKQYARELYGLLRNFKFIHQLTVSFDWQLQESDLNELNNAIAASSIRHLDLDGEGYSGPWDPLLQVLANPKLHMLSVKKFKNFLHGVSRLPKDIKIRSFDFSDQLVPNDVAHRLINACPLLAKLALSTSNIKLTFEHIQAVAESHPSLATLNIKQSDRSQSTNAYLPSVTYYFNKHQRSVLSATLTFRTLDYNDLIQLPKIKKVVYQPIRSIEHLALEDIRPAAQVITRRFIEMESLEFNCPSRHFRPLFAVLREEHTQSSLLRRVKLIDEHGSFLVTHDIRDHNATRINMEDASSLVEDTQEVLQRSGTQRDTSMNRREELQRTQSVSERGPARALLSSHLPPYSAPSNRLQPPLVLSPRPHYPVFMGDGSLIKTLVLDSTQSPAYVEGIYNSICNGGYCALERLVWDITDLNDVGTIKVVLAMLGAAQTSNPSRKPIVEIKVRLVSDICRRLLESSDRSYLCILLASHATRLEFYGGNLDPFLPRLRDCYDWDGTMGGLRELVVDGQKTNLNYQSLNYLQDVIRHKSRTLKAARPLQQLVLQNLQLFDPQQWRDLLGSIDWLTVRHINFRGSNFQQAQLADLETAYIQMVKRCRTILSTNTLSSRDAAMIEDLRMRENGRAPLIFSLYLTGVTSLQAQGTQARLQDRGITWCHFDFDA